MTATTEPWVVPASVAPAAALEPGRRPQAFLVGAAVPAIVAAAATLAAIDWVPQVALGGVLAGSVLAAWQAGALGRASWAWVSTGLGVLAPLLSAVVVVIVLFAGSGGGSGGLETLAGFLFILLYALGFGVILGAPVAIPVSLVVGWLVHRSAAMPVRRAWLHIAALGIAGVVGVAIALPRALS